MKISEAFAGTSFVDEYGAICVVTGFNEKTGYECMKITKCWYVDDIEIVPISYTNDLRNNKKEK